ncbi:hypothetical protein BJ742DRAFT_833197 [Cladochytrium replicatum]|nr:hypothetical protein BJ742DRAFT_833197 [Cladochytrium replicatum]
MSQTAIILALLKKNARLRIARKRWLMDLILVFVVPLFILQEDLIRYAATRGGIRSINQTTRIGTSSLDSAAWKFGELAYADVSSGSWVGKTVLDALVASADTKDDSARVVKHATKADMDKHCTHQPCFAGVLFSGVEADADGRVVGVNYTLKHNRESDNDEIERNGLLLNLQLSIDSFIADLILSNATATSSGSTNGSGIAKSRVVYDNQVVTRSDFKIIYDFMANWGGLVVVLAMMSMVFSLLTDVVGEKERKITEGLFTMGVSRSSYNLSWVISYVVLYLPLWILVPTFLKITFFQETNIALPLVLVLLLALSIISLCFVLEVFLRSSRSAGLVGMGIIALVSFAGIMIFEMTSPPAALRGVLCLISPLAFLVGTQSLSSEELVGRPATLTSGTVPLVAVFVVLAIDIALYSTLAWYLGEVYPTVGQGRNPFFVFSGDFWYARRGIFDEQPEPLNPRRPEVEPLDPHSHIGINVRGLTKRFAGSGKQPGRLAVDNVSLMAPRGEVVSMLGPNGAGKTTLISLLTGTLAPSFGSALIEGVPIADRARASSMIGYCPQFDFLFPYLTVKQTFELFAVIKGVQRHAIEAEVLRTIERVALVEKTNQFVENLSGGQKRRVSVGIAFIGNSPVVLLDEPTSGLDPLSRRAVWKIVQEGKHERSILFCTHFLDEASYLSDRIAIMANGQLQCYGTPAFLKRIYGRGYVLNITLKHHEIRAPTQIVSVIRSFSRTVEDPDIAATEMTFRLGMDDQETYPDMLRVLEANKDGLGISHYTFSTTTLQDVFFAVFKRSEATNEQRSHIENSTLVNLNQASSSSDHQDGFELSLFNSRKAMKDVLGEAGQYPPASFIDQVGAFMRKIFIQTRRDYSNLLLRILVPLLAVTIVAFILKGSTYECTPLLTDTYTLQYPAIYPAGPPLLATQESVGFIRLADPGIKVVAVSSREDLVRITQNDMDSRGGLEFTTGGSPVSSTWMGDFSVTRPSSDLLATLVLSNLATNTLLKTRLNNVNTYRIKTSLEFFDSDPPAFVPQYDGKLIGSGLILVAAFALQAALTVIPIVKERSSKTKQQMKMSGARGSAYWASYMIFDLCIILFTSLLAAAILAAAGLQNHGNYSFMASMFSACSIVLMLLAYTMSYFVENEASGVAAVFSYTVFVTLIWFIPFTAIASTSASQTALTIVSTVFSAYNPGVALMYTILVLGNTANLLCQADFTFVSPWSALNRQFMVLGCQFVAFLVVIYFLENAQSLFHFEKRVAGNEVASDSDDVRVLEEEQRLESRSTQDLLMVKKVHKRYPTNTNGVDKVALHSLSIGVDRGECFSLIGPNGAGKTTSFAIISHDVLPTSGDVLVGGRSVWDEGPAIQREGLGVCPQFDRLHENLTPREHFEMYGQLRGIPRKAVVDVADALIELLDLGKFADVQTKILSGGNKRKTSVAIALIGRPQLVLLDECTTGMDPLSKRIIWDLVIDLLDEHAVVLTTHSMEEVEAISTRIGIMDRGRLKIVGSIGNIRTAVGMGYELDFVVPNVSARQVEALTADVQQHFIGAVKMEGAASRYHIPPNQFTSVADLLEVAQRLCATHPFVQDFSVSPPSLDQIFVDLALKSENDPNIQEESAAERKYPYSLFPHQQLNQTTAILVNISWFILGFGWMATLGYLFLGALAALGAFVVGPACVWSFKRALFVASPYNVTVTEDLSRARRPGVVLVLLKVCEFGAVIVVGLLAALLHVFLAFFAALTIFGLPFAWLHLKLALLALSPSAYRLTKYTRL